MKNGAKVVMPEMAFEEMFDAPLAVADAPERVAEIENGEPLRLEEELKEIEMPVRRIPPAEYFDGLMKETYYRSYFGKNLLWRFYQDAFQAFSLTTKLIVTSGDDWNEGENAVYEVCMSNYSGFDFRNVTGYLQVIPGTGNATPRYQKVAFGDLRYRGRVCKEFPLFAKKDGEGEITLKLKFSGFIGEFKQMCRYDGTSFRWMPFIPGGWQKYVKPPFEQKYTIYPG